MFTGLVAATGTVDSLARNGEGARLRVRTELAAELGQGDSVAVNGVCLTARDPDAESFCADVMEETLRRSSLAPLGEGDAVNLELPLRAGDRLGGHVVQGHVDGVGTVESAPRRGLLPRPARERAGRNPPLRGREGLDRGGWRLAHRFGG